MALDLSRRTFLGAAASSAAMAMTNNFASAADAMEDASLIPGLLPDRPDETQPALLKAWNRMFKGPKKWVAADLDNLDRNHPRKGPPLLGGSNPFAAVQQPDAHQFLGAARTRHEDSSAWCGASITADRGRQFVQIYGEFTVPTASNPPDDPREKHYSSTWIGLDGDRRYLNSTLPQVGVQQNTPGPNTGKLPEDLPDYYAWFQWWAPRRVKAELWWIQGVPVMPGDDVMALIWAFDPDHVLVYFRNFRTHLITTFVMAAPEAFHHRRDAEPYNPIVSGATAEWMVEDPSKSVEADADDQPPELEKLAAYTLVTFRNCVAGLAPAPGQATSEKVLTAPRFKRMYHYAQNPSRTRLVSRATRGASETELVVSYGGFE